MENAKAEGVASISSPVEQEIADLRQLNALVLRQPTPSPFRGDAVFCLTKDGREIAFCDSELITEKLDQVMALFCAFFHAASSMDAMAHALAFVWMGLIAIHPFADGNGRTALAYISHKLAGSRFAIRADDFHVLRRYLIRGETQADLKNLTMIMLVLLKKAGVKS